MESLNKCSLCPRKCNVNRNDGKKGYCGENNIVRIARASIHMWEEPCLSGTRGSGTVFFSGCNLHCVYCQNSCIANGDVGKEISVERLAEIFIEQQDRGANNINLVTPTHYVPQIVCAVETARNRGLKLPIVYNTSSYETVETIKMLDGIVDIYLPDLKYYNEKIALRYSNATDYFEIAKKAIDKMVHQAGYSLFAEDKDVCEPGMMKKGVIVRHLMLPGQIKDSKAIVKYLYETYGDSIYISLMNQYTPMPGIGDKYPELNHTVTAQEYDELVDYAIDLGVENGFIQEGGTASESFIPDFNMEGT